ncbi:MAG TPA: methylenetetrahydrofolate reductase [Pseudolysinimonas sp.]|nr:methylenetetrahydrofolate reductase [Pseudolysinimonas sp.]
MKLLDDYSIEMTGKDVPALEEARNSIPQGTRINVTFLGNEDLKMRVTASKAVREFGFVPIPHVSARRLASQEALDEFLVALQGVQAIEKVFVVGGDPAVPEGPYASSAEVIQTGLLPGYGVKEVNIAGYPEGHPDITDEQLWEALESKNKALLEQGLDGVILTQFSFDVDPVFTWLEEVRKRGINLPIRLGIPGPAGIKRLLGYARRFGVGSSATIVAKYGMSLTNLLGTAGPDKFLRALSDGYDPAKHGEVKLHFYAFGGLKTTADWITKFDAETK